MKTYFALGLCLVMFFAGKPVNNGYNLGDTVSDFKLKNTNGKMVSLSDYSTALGIILIFDCNTCPYSKAYNERIVALNEKYATKGFPVIAINANDPIDSLVTAGIPEAITRSPIAMPARGAQSNLTPDEVKLSAAYVCAIASVRGEPWPGGHQTHTSTVAGAPAGVG